MNTKKFTYYFLLLTFIALSVVAIINYAIDPYWTFKHSNALNNKQVDFDERQQKTNYLYFVNHNFDSLLLGSSRTTYLKESHFKGKFFNYASNGMYPYEYEYFINTFKTLTQTEPHEIIIGVDFFGSNKSENMKPSSLSYYENTISPLYRFKLLVNYNILKHSFQNMKQNMLLKKNFYNRERVKDIRKIKDLHMQINSTIKKLKDYQYDDALPYYWVELQTKFPNSKFTIFTTPVTMAQLKAYRDVGLMPSYIRWLHDLVDSFGSISHFMTVNSYTMNDNNFFDSNHFTPTFGNEIAEELAHQQNKISIKLDKNTIDEYIQDIEQKINSLE